MPFKTFLFLKSSLFSPIAIVILLMAQGYTTAAVSDTGSSLSFAAARSFAVGTNPFSATMGDFNHDGLLDLVTANLDSGNLSVLLGKGDGTFQPAQYYPVGNRPTEVVVFDFNGDGNLDLANSNEASVSVLLGNGDGTFQPAVNYDAGFGIAGLLLGDVNHDGHVDLLGPRFYNSPGLPLLLGKGDGTFQQAVELSFSFSAFFSALVDLDQDGNADLVLRDADGVSVAWGTNSGFLAPARVSSGKSPGCVRVVDVNGDSQPDLVFLSGGTISVLLNNGDRSFKSPIEYPPLGPWTSCIASGDFNGDAKPDLAVNAGPLWVLLNKGDGTFFAPRSYDIGSGRFVTADFNRDGLADLVVLNYQQVLIMLSKGDGTFLAGTNYNGVSNPSLVLAGDFNGDGHTDLSVWRGEASLPDSGIFIGNGTGRFEKTTNALPGLHPGAGGVVADFNQDGKADLALIGADFGNGILLGKGDGTFEPAITLRPHVPYHGVTAGDVNGDGLMDLVFGSIVSGNVSVALGKGDGTFQNPTVLQVGESATSIVIADFNRDGKQDLGVSDRASNKLLLFLAKGDDGFESAVTYDAGLAPEFLAVGDFNHDGQPDLAAANNQSANVSVLLGKGDGTFESAVNYSVGLSPRSLKVNDFDGDGNDDLAVLNADSGNISILAGRGDGTFNSALNYGAGAIPFSLAVSDFNGDGRADLAIANAFEGGTSVLLNTSEIPQPRLNLVRAESRLTICWAAPAKGFVLESTTNLTQWQPNMSGLSTNHGRIEAVFPLNEPERYFRLRRN